MCIVFTGVETSYVKRRQKYTELEKLPPVHFYLFCLLFNLNAFLSYSDFYAVKGRHPGQEGVKQCHIQNSQINSWIPSFFKITRPNE